MTVLVSRQWHAWQPCTHLLGYQRWHQLVEDALGPLQRTLHSTLGLEARPADLFFLPGNGDGHASLNQHQDLPLHGGDVLPFR